MLTPDQIDAIRDKIENITEPLNQYLIRNIVRRIKEAGTITSTARYEAEIARMLGVSQREIREYFKTLIPAKKGELNRLYKQVARLTYKQTVATTGVDAVKLSPALNNIVGAAAKLADDDFTNITQTLGMIDPYGNALPLRDAYVSACDFAIKQVMTGASDYQTAVRNAVKNVAKYGVQVVDYESGVHSSLDVAVRRSVFGGMGLMVEQIEQQAAKDIGADGWEISAHEASAKDHEPYQGRQYSDEEFFKLNGTPEEAGILKRRIGTLNCKHVAFPIVLGVSQPQYTEEELEAMAKRNEEGLEYQGKHYTMYEATQMQRKLERRIRKAKREVIAYEEAGLTDDLAKAKGKYNALMGAYSDFNKASGLRPQPARLEVLKMPKHNGLAATIGGGDIPIHEAPMQLATLQTEEEISSAFEWFAETFKDSDTEHALVISESGETRLCFGTEDRVFPDSDLDPEFLNNSRIIHNHPKEHTMFSFSNDDLELFIKYNLSKLEGVDNKYRYSLGRNASDIDEMPDNSTNENNFMHAFVVNYCLEHKIGYRRIPND